MKKGTKKVQINNVDELNNLMVEKYKKSLLEVSTNFEESTIRRWFSKNTDPTFIDAVILYESVISEYSDIKKQFSFDYMIGLSSTKDKSLYEVLEEVSNKLKENLFYLYRNNTDFSKFQANRSTQYPIKINDIDVEIFYSISNKIINNICKENIQKVHNRKMNIYIKRFWSAVMEYVLLNTFSPNTKKINPEVYEKVKESFFDDISDNKKNQPDYQRLRKQYENEITRNKKFTKKIESIIYSCSKDNEFMLSNEIQINQISSIFLSIPPIIVDNTCYIPYEEVFKQIFNLEEKFDCSGGQPQTVTITNGSTSVSVTMGSDKIKIQNKLNTNEKTLKSGVPFVRNGFPMLPFNEVIEALGFKAELYYVSEITTKSTEKWVKGDDLIMPHFVLKTNIDN